MIKQRIGIAAVALASVLLGAQVALTAETQCKKIAVIQQNACQAEARADFLTSTANCSNLVERAERKQCAKDAEGDSAEAHALCREQKQARRTLCERLREDRYDPNFDPADFQTQFENPTITNPYFPLAVGYRWHYSAPEEEVFVEVQDETKQIEGVTCVVVRDLVLVDGVELEDTDDWFAQRTDGAVSYCGEISQNFELFEGDDPLRAELVDVEGSWKAGRDEALPGTAFLRNPVVGATYRQELARGTAEDAARVVSTTYAPGRDAELDRFVPAALANLLCSHADCVVTKEFTPISPGSFERKYYARGVGFFLAVNPQAGEAVRLTDCNVAPVCDELP